jgi:ParB family protein of integrating conjugative element (PFGI_1 class)
MAKNDTVRIPRSASIEEMVKRQGGVHATPADIRRAMQVHASIHIPNPKGGTTGMKIDHEEDDARLDLPVGAIDFYDKNPRTEVNPNYEEIKESIRELGIVNPLVVTKRPGTTRYMLCAGGNTRLKAIQELLAETQDVRFAKTTCTYRAWRAESHVLAGHMIENEVRGDMTFWDKASGIAKLKLSLEDEDGETMSIRDLEARLKSIGYPVGRTNLQYFAFAIERLSLIGKYTSIPVVKELQPRFSSLRRLTSKFGIDDAQTNHLLDQAIGEYAKTITDVMPFATSLLLAKIDKFLAEQVKVDVESFRLLNRANDQLPQMTLTELRHAIRQTYDDSHLAAGVPNASEKQASTAGVEISTPPVIPPNVLRRPSPSNGLPSQPTMKPPSGPSPTFDQPNDLRPASASESKIASASNALAGDPQDLRDLTQATRIRLIRACAEYAQAMQVDAMFRQAPKMPYGFFVEFPDEQLDTSTNGPQRTLAWWILASLSSQRDLDITLLGIPESENSEWRRLSAGGPNIQIGELEGTIQQRLGDASELADTQVWFDPKNRAARLALPLMALYNEMTEILEQRQSLIEQATQATP